MIGLRRAITMKSSSIGLQYRGHSINLIDSPGHMDFCSEVYLYCRSFERWGSGVSGYYQWWSSICQTRLLPKREFLDNTSGSDLLTQAERVEVCDASIDAPCVAFVYKMFAVPSKLLPQRGLHGELLNNEDCGIGESDECFLAFARIFSGVLRSGQRIFVLSALYDP